MTPEIRSDGDSRENIAITIYHNDRALIRESRRLSLQAGLNRVALRDVSARIRPETASLSGRDASLRLLEQNFDYDLLSAESLLEQYIGKHITTIRTNPATGAENHEPATVLANNGSVILQYTDRIETGLPANVRLAFADVPTSLRDRPTLTVDLHSDQAGSQTVNLAYLSSGFRWKADYVLNLAKDEKTLNLAGWVTVENKSGSSYRDATLQLVAGDIAQIMEDDYDGEKIGEITYYAAAEPNMQEETLFEYHLYTLNRPTTLKNKQQKQIALLSANQVPVQKEYRLQGNNYYYYLSHSRKRPEDGEKRKIEVSLEFTNEEASQLGLPLPKGIVRVYKNDSAGRPQFIGEDRIDHTAKNETVCLRLGNAFDINGVWKMLHRQCLGLVEKNNKDSIMHYEVTCSIALHNAKNEAVTVKVVEPIPGDWEISEESHPHQKVEAHLAQWHIPIAAEGKVELIYTAHIKY